MHIYIEPQRILEFYCNLTRCRTNCHFIKWHILIISMTMSTNNDARPLRMPHETNRSKTPPDCHATVLIRWCCHLDVCTAAPHLRRGLAIVPEPEDVSLRACQHLVSEPFKRMLQQQWHTPGVRLTGSWITSTIVTSMGKRPAHKPHRVLLCQSCAPVHGGANCGAVPALANGSGFMAHMEPCGCVPLDRNRDSISSRVLSTVALGSEWAAQSFTTTRTDWAANTTSTHPLPNSRKVLPAKERWWCWKHSSVRFSSSGHSRYAETESRAIRSKRLHNAAPGINQLLLISQPQVKQRTVATPMVSTQGPFGLHLRASCPHHASGWAGQSFAAEISLLGKFGVYERQLCAHPGRTATSHSACIVHRSVARSYIMCGQILTRSHVVIGAYAQRLLAGNNKTVKRNKIIQLNTPLQGLCWYTSFFDIAGTSRL